MPIDFRQFFPNSVSGVFSPESLRCALVQEPGQVQRGSGEGSEGSGEGLGGFGAEPGEVQQPSGKGSGEGSRKPWEALVQSQVKFNRVPEKVPEKDGEALVQSQVRFNRVPEFGRLRCKGRSGSAGFRRRFRCRSGRFWCKARSVSTGFRRRFRRRLREALVQSQVKFTRVPRRRFRRRSGTLRCKSQLTGFRRRSGRSGRLCKVRFKRVPEKVPEKVWEASVQRRVRFNRICGHLTHGNPAEVFPALGLAARFRQICEIKSLRLLGIPPKLIATVAFAAAVRAYSATQNLGMCIGTILTQVFRQVHL